MAENEYDDVETQSELSQSEEEDSQRTSSTGHNVPQMGHNVPQMGHNAPQMGHNAPQMGHNVPQMGHNSPQMGHNVPQTKKQNYDDRSSSDESIGKHRQETDTTMQKTHVIKPKPKTRKKAWNQSHNAGFDDIDTPPTYQGHTPAPQGQGPYLHTAGTAQSPGTQTGRKPLCPGVAFSILWFLSILVIGFPAAIIISIFYVLLIPIGACVPTLTVALDGMLFLIKLPYVLARNMITMAKCDGEAWDLKNLDGHNNPV